VTNGAPAVLSSIVHVAILPWVSANAQDAPSAITAIKANKCFFK